MSNEKWEPGQLHGYMTVWRPAPAAIEEPSTSATWGWTDPPGARPAGVERWSWTLNRWAWSLGLMAVGICLWLAYSAALTAWLRR